MKKIQIASLIALLLEVLLWAAGRTLLLLPDWTIRLNGVMIIITMPLLAFVSVRLIVKKED